MCGRATQTTSTKILRDLFQARGDVDLPPRYNLAPKQRMPIVRQNPDDKGRDLLPVRWGLIPSWARDAKIGYKLINARAEGVEKKPAFRAAYKRRRCLILLDGFYEWRREGKQKTPFYIRLRGGQPFACAGLWERWKDPNDPETKELETCTILTTQANELVGSLHDRMPVILEPSAYDAWLDVEDPSPDLERLARPYPVEAMEMWEVSPRVNRWQEEDEELIKPVSS